MYTVKNLLNELMNTRKKKTTGSEAVEEAISGFKDVIENLNVALNETDVELQQAKTVVAEAVAESTRISHLLTEGHNFVEHLKKLL